MHAPRVASRRPLRSQIATLMEEKKAWTEREHAMERRASLVEDENKRLKDENARIKDELQFLRSEVRPLSHNRHGMSCHPERLMIQQTVSLLQLKKKGRNADDEPSPSNKRAKPDTA